MNKPFQSPSELPRAVQWAMAWLMMCCSLFVVNAVVVLFGLHVTAFSLPMAVVVALIALYWSSKLDGRAVNKKCLLIIGGTFMVATVLLGYVVSWVWEYSYWGRGFYTDAIVALTDGWNPIYEGAERVPEIVYRSGKAVWLMDASFYAFLGHYEMAKLHTLFFAIPTFLLARHCFIRCLEGHERLATLAALLLLLNPVALSQMFTYYDDAALAFATICFLMLAYLTLNEGYLHSDLLLTMAFLWVFILNMQMGGFRTAVVLGVSLLIFVAIFYKKQAVRWFAIRAGLVAMIGFVILGFNPYIQNWLDTGNPLHALNVTTAYMPWVLEGKTQLGQFFYSMVASPDMEVLQWNIVVQQLTAFVNSAYAAADVRLRGFGFIGGLLLVLAVLLLIVASILPKEQDTDEDGIYCSEEDNRYENYLSTRVVFLWLSLPVVALIIFSPTPWWARTIAVGWSFIPLAVVALCVRHGNGKSATAKLLLTAAFLNCALLAFSTLTAVTSSTVDMKGHWERMNSTALPSAEDARQHNEYIKNFKAWNTLKAKGEETREEKAIWTKIEGIVK